MTERHYLLEILEGKYHLLPDSSVSQDTQMKALKSAGALQTKFMKQKDGSRFKVIYTKNLDQGDVIERIQYLNPKAKDIWKETKIRVEELRRLVQENIVLQLNSLEYRAYHTNTFLDSYRVLPVIIDRGLRTIYNACSLFPQLQPEDDWGVLVSDLSCNELELEGYLPTVITYLSDYRMCPTCGRVSHMNKPPLRPWTSRDKKMNPKKEET